jgi:hypothetical protein
MARDRTMTRVSGFWLGDAGIGRGRAITLRHWSSDRAVEPWLVFRVKGWHMGGWIFAAQAANDASAFRLGSPVAVMVLCGMAGAFIGYTRGRAGLGFILGALLGPIGWIIVLLMSRRHTGYKG